MQTYFFWRQRFGDNAVATRVWQGKEPRFKGATVEFPTEEEELEAFDRISGAAKVTKTKKSTAARVARHAKRRAVAAATHGSASRRICHNRHKTW
jgi:hypothetical protein